MHRQRRGDARLGGLAVAHAGAVAHVGAAVGQPLAVIGGLAVAVGDQVLHIADVAVGQHEIARHHLGEVQHVRGDGIDLLDAEALGCLPGHRAVDVVPQRRDGAELHHRRARRIPAQRSDAAGAHVVAGRATDQRLEDLVGLAEHAVAGHALRLPDLHALAHRARTGRQTLEVGPHVDVPGAHLGGGGGAPYARQQALRPGPGAGAGQQHGRDGFTTPGHC